MPKLTHITFALTLALTYGCSGIGPSADTISKALAVNEAQHQVFTAQADAFRKIVTRAAMSNETRDAILDAINEDVAAFGAANSAVRDYLAAFGELTPEDLERALDKALDVYLTIDRPGDGGSPTGR